MMKKSSYLLLLLSAALISVSFCSAAYADEVLEPPVVSGMPEGEYDFIFTPSDVNAASGNNEDVPEITVVTPAQLGEPGEWRMELEGATFSFKLYEEDSVDSWNYTLSALYVQQEYSENNTFRYTIFEPGDYVLFCYWKDASGKEKYDYIEFTVENRDGAITVSSVVKDIVDECREEISLNDPEYEYKTALWLHDWITTHSYYDTTYCYHGPDSILFYGTGVCDSYSKLYLMLLREAGLEAERITGWARGGHAWNLVKIDGEWCHVDPTWDDPLSTDDLVSGSERHLYFGLSDEIISLDHSEYEVPYPCVSLQNCAARKENTHKMWLSHIWQDIEYSMQTGRFHGEFDTRGILMAEGSSYYAAPSYVTWGMNYAAILMSGEDWEFPGNRRVNARFAYDPDSNLFYYDVSMEAPDTFVLPSDTETISEGAFQNSESMEAVIIPEGVKQIGQNAFAGCHNLMWITIYSDDVEIDPTAFADIPEGFVIISHEGSTASTFAESCGITNVVMDPAQS